MVLDQVVNKIKSIHKAIVEYQVSPFVDTLIKFYILLIIINVLAYLIGAIHAF